MWGRMTLGLALLVTLLIRVLPFRNFINPQGGFYFYSVDAYDHLRRITLGVSRFPGLADFDYYAAFPHGLGQLWAPGFDYLLSALCLLGGGSREVIETVCFFFNPLAAALAVLAVYFIARASFKSLAAGVAAAVVLALNPASIAYSLPMNFDHHAVEPLVALLLFSLPLLEDRGRLHPAGMAMTVLSLLLAILFWRGSTLYWGLAFVSALGRAFAANNRSLALEYGLAFGAGALILAVYCLIDPWGGARQIAFGVISWFHVVVLAGGAGVLSLFGLCRSRRHFWWGLGGLGVVALAAVLAGPLAGMVRQFLGGLSFVRGQGDPWLDSNSELRGVFKERYSFWYSASYLTPFWFLAPIAVWLGVRKWNTGGRVDSLALNFLVWSPVLAMGFIIRYSHIAGLFTSLTAGSLVAALRGEQAKRGSRVVLAVGILLLLPGLPHYQEAMTADLPDHMKYGLYGEGGVLAWMRQETPPTSHWLNPVSPPEYGVLARWPLGALLYQVAARPALATAFGWEGYGFYQEAGFWVAEDEAKALGVTREAQVRYVIAQSVHDLKTDFSVATQGQAKGGLAPDTVGPEFHQERSMHTRLMQGDGSMMQEGGTLLSALESFRLVHESPFLAGTGGAGPSRGSYYKVFEVVKGALVIGKAPSTEAVTLMLELMTTRQRKLTYLTQVQAGPDGTFAVRVPYATTGLQGDSRPLADYTLYVGRTARGPVSVSEEDVMQGKTIRLD